ncbi:MAG: UDP-N-acetylglucosamine 1-carboxyvinyltransferase [Deltaproteobacteria bacterium]|nr:UDP-N-acetylglucosamine 1-carboxyvinyltransferase [Deltaproteobacteria bacterium]
MDKIVIEGGVPLEGEVAISGAKNAALPIMAATLLAPGVHYLHNMPRLADIRTFKRVLGLMGVQFEEGGGHGGPPHQHQELPHRPGGPPDPEEDVLVVDASRLTGWMAPYEVVKTMRAAVLVLGPLVARARQASVSLPGGCAIGARPIDQHLKGLEAMGVKITLNQGYVEAKAKRLEGAEIILDIPTVTGTENLMMAATLAEGTTVIHNAAQEPEVADLARFLVAMGARIEGIGTERLTIHGVNALTPTSYRVMSDRIEAGTYLAAAAITRGRVSITNAPVGEMSAVLEKFQEAGVRFTIENSSILVEPSGSLTGVDVKTLPYPGFPTDMQAQFMALMTLAKGASIITETIFENRFMHVPELNRMGADIAVSGNHAVVRGRRHLLGAPVMATDLRASASLVIAGLAAKNTTEIHRVYHLDRGYARLAEKLAALGARLKRMPA